jgi:hypothetical protein
VVIHEPTTTRGWHVRVVRRGIALTEFFSDRKYGGKAGALSEAMHHRDRVVRELRPYSRSELARRPTARNTSGIPGVRRRIKPVKKPGGKVLEYVVWTASGTPLPGQRKTRDFYVSKLGEDDAREAAIAQRLHWERQMELHEMKRMPKPH